MSDGVRLPPALQQMGGKSGSPVKENSFMHRSISVEESNKDHDDVNQSSATGLNNQEEEVAGNVSPPPAREGMPIRGTGQ